MILVTRQGITEEELDHIRERVESLGLRTHVSRGETLTVVGCIGDEERLQHIPLLSIPGVVAAHTVMKPYKLASREFAADPTRIPLGGVEVGGRGVVVVAGPCSVEGGEMLSETAFQGMGQPGLELLASVRETHGLPVVTEVMDTRQVELVAGYADVLQIGTRNMQNFNLLTEVGRVQRPVLLKRGMSATIKDLLMSAEYIMQQGNSQVILCERGIRTFETATRNTFDLAAIPVLKRETHLPVIADPSHAGGRRDLVAPLAFAAIAAGADGLLVEAHPDPESAWSDGDQSLDFGEFERMMGQLAPFAEAAGRTLAPL